MEKKYKLTSETKIFKHKGRDITIYRIEALRDFGKVKKGDLGGWVESEKNLVHEGICWVFDDAIVCCNGIVRGRAWAYGNAIICDNGMICGDGKAYGNAIICDNGKVASRGSVFENAIISGNRSVGYDERVYE